MRIRRFVASAGALLIGCGGGGNGGGTGVLEPGEILLISGNGQSGPAGTTLLEELVVEVRTDDGRAVSGATVTFAALAGGGFPGFAEVVTDANGRAQVGWILGPRPGEQNRLRASIAGLGVEFEAQSTAPVLGTNYEGRRGYVNWTVGDLPLIVAVPHGGDRVPAEIPDRTSGETDMDLDTEILSDRIGDEFSRFTGKRPHIIESNLHRLKLDPNRDLPDAAEPGNAFSERSWREYHMFIEAAREVILAQHGRGLFVDLHGHAHPIDRVELGYLLSGTQLALPDAQLDALANTTSIRTLAEQSPLTLTELLRGPNSLGTMLEASLFPTVPSEPQPHPGNDPYFSGGYSTQRHGSLNGGMIDGVQIETYYVGIRDTQIARGQFSIALVLAFQQFAAEHYGIQLGACLGGACQ